jgi:hypothetical protein
MSVIRLEKWAVIDTETDPYVAPELRRPHLHGNAFGHPRFPDGKDVTTGPIVGRRGNNPVTKSGSEYELMDVDPEWERIYPGSKDRFLKSLQSWPVIGVEANT